MKIAVILSVLCMGFLSAVPARATDKTGEEKTDDLAKEAFDEGITLYNMRKYTEAAEKFHEANRLKPSWKLQYNIGQCEAAAKRYDLSLDAFELYLTQGGDEVEKTRQNEVQQEINRLKGLVGFLTIRAPNGASVVIDGVNRGTAPLPGRVRVSAGMIHHIVVRRDDVIFLDRSIRLGSGEVSELDASSAAPSEVSNTSDASASNNTESTSALTQQKSPLRPAGFALLGVGAGTLIAGIVTGALTLSKAGDLESACPDNNCSDNEQGTHDAAEKLAVSTNVLLPVGGVLAVTGAVLLIVGSKRKKTEAPVAIFPGPFGVSIKGRF